ncbi:MAG: hypothetical protein F9K18_05635 [Thermoanaerobaculia bacterium]|nr:MAG: hypothetical protein F9K18_05635 [Thermoanaerobaculia bacterium]
MVFPLTNRSALSLALRPTANPETVPQLLGAHLEAEGFDVTELDGGRISFRGPFRMGHVRFLPSAFEAVSRGSLEVATGHGRVDLSFRLDFPLVAGLAVAIAVVFYSLLVGVEELHPALAIACLLAYLFLSLSLTAWWTNRRFARWLRECLQKEWITER